MPGFLYHLACAKMVADKRLAINSRSYDQFLIGCLIPDLAENRLRSHFKHQTWSPELHEAVENIDLAAAQNTLLETRDLLKLGIYLHLYSEEMLGWKFAGDRFSDQAIGLRLIAQQLVPVDKIFTLPRSLPLTGIAMYDARGDRDWRQEVEEILVEPPDSGSEYDYMFARRCIWQTAKRFLTEVLTDELAQSLTCTSI